MFSKTNEVSFKVYGNSIIIIKEIELYNIISFGLSSLRRINSSKSSMTIAGLSFAVLLKLPSVPLQHPIVSNFM